MPTSFNDLYERVDDALDGRLFDNDVEMAAKIEIDLAELLRPALDVEQSDALSVAKGFWSEKVSDEERLKCLEVMSRRQESISMPNSPEANINRLVFSCLTNTTGLSSYTGEFLVGLAEGAGLSPEAVETVFERHVPTMRRGQSGAQ